MRAVLLLLAIATLTILIVGVLISRAPSWWPAQTTSTAAEAEAVERAVTAQIANDHSDGAQWGVELTEAAANAWLAHRFPRWLDHENIAWPWPSGRVAVRFTDGLIRIGATRPNRDAPRIVGASVEVVSDKDGALRVRLRSVSLGGLTLPGAPARIAAARVLRAADPDGDIALILGDREIPAPLLRLEGGREVELVAIACVDGRIRLTFRQSGAKTSAGLP